MVLYCCKTGRRFIFLRSLGQRRQIRNMGEFKILFLLNIFFDPISIPLQVYFVLIFRWHKTTNVCCMTLSLLYCFGSKAELMMVSRLILILLMAILNRAQDCQSIFWNISMFGWEIIFDMFLQFHYLSTSPKYFCNIMNLNSLRHIGKMVFFK